MSSYEMPLAVLKPFLTFENNWNLVKYISPARTEWPVRTLIIERTGVALIHRCQFWAAFLRMNDAP